MLRPSRRPMCFFCACTRRYAVRAIVLGELKYTACTSLQPSERRQVTRAASESTYCRRIAQKTFPRTHAGSRWRFDRPHLRRDAVIGRRALPHVATAAWRS